LGESWVARLVWSAPNTWTANPSFDQAGSSGPREPSRVAFTLGAIAQETGLSVMAAKNQLPRLLVTSNENRIPT
jgi:hypothetical protein